MTTDAPEDPRPPRLRLFIPFESFRWAEPSLAQQGLAGLFKEDALCGFVVASSEHVEATRSLRIELVRPGLSGAPTVADVMAAREAGIAVGKYSEFERIMDLLYSSDPPLKPED